MRAAANSMARGKPSSRRQISATAAALPGVRVNSCRTAAARATNNATAGLAANSSRFDPSPSPGGRSSGGTVTTCSARRRRRTRLVARIWRLGQVASRPARAGAAPRTCSRLSTTRRRGRSAIAVARRSAAATPGTSGNPRAWATVGSTNAVFADRRQLDPGDASSTPAARFFGHRVREPALADPTRSGQRHPPHAGGHEQGGDVPDLPVPPKQRCWRQQVERAECDLRRWRQAGNRAQGGRPERCFGGLCQPEPIDEELQRVPARMTNELPLEVTDPTHAESGPFRERLLGQPRLGAVAPQERPKGPCGLRLRGPARHRLRLPVLLDPAPMLHPTSPRHNGHTWLITWVKRVAIGPRQDHHRSRPRGRVSGSRGCKPPIGTTVSAQAEAFRDRRCAGIPGRRASRKGGSMAIGTRARFRLLEGEPSSSLTAALDATKHSAQATANVVRSTDYLRGHHHGSQATYLPLHTTQRDPSCPSLVVSRSLGGAVGVHPQPRPDRSLGFRRPHPER